MTSPSIDPSIRSLRSLTRDDISGGRINARAPKGRQMISLGREPQEPGQMNEKPPEGATDCVPGMTGSLEVRVLFPTRWR